MPSLLTPKQVARAMDVSESTIKRWCDKGIIRTQYTAGGHRRIERADVLEFSRVTDHRLVFPEALGLPATSGETERVTRRAMAQFRDALLGGQHDVCRQVILDLYLANCRLSEICDSVIAEAFREVGDQWACGEADVFQERRGCEITVRILHELRTLVLPPHDRARLAIGGTISDDEYMLGTTMAELILHSAGWNAVSLGTNLPFDSLSAAIISNKPWVFWLSVSYVADDEAFVEGYNQLVQRHAEDTAFAIGGYGLTPALRERVGCVDAASWKSSLSKPAYCASMQELESVAHKVAEA